MIEDGEKRHYTAIKNILKLLRSLNSTHKGAYHFCMNFLNGFRAASVKDKHYTHCSSNSHVKDNTPTEEEKWLKFHDGQYQFKVLFILYADFESTLKPVDERYKEKMNRVKAGRKGKTLHTKKINTHVLLGWCVHSTFSYGDVPNPLKMYWGEDCHYTVLYRGAAHNNCNLKYRIADHILIVFHNLSGYDGRFNKNDIGVIL